MSFIYEVVGMYEGRIVRGEYIANTEEEARAKATQDKLTNVKIIGISTPEKITIECEN